MKRLGILVGLVGIGLLVAGISYEVTHQAKPVTKHAEVPIFEVSYASAPKTPEYSNFSDNVSLWDAPQMPGEAANASFGSPIFPGNSSIRPNEVQKRIAKDMAILSKEER